MDLTGLFDSVTNAAPTLLDKYIELETAKTTAKTAANNLAATNIQAQQTAVTGGGATTTTTGGVTATTGLQLTPGMMAGIGVAGMLVIGGVILALTRRN
ncbi:MAG: hypothetical protein LBK99_10670 [Opitutaceae bacterium]|jgi:hypothetical protein|nr:hypothetical protein [Opitutaceae bacterium]